MKLVFIGADHEVTGRCHYLEVGNRHILVDYGMEQGVNVFENAHLPVDEAMIDYVLLTHAHVDHSGLLIHGKAGGLCQLPVGFAYFLIHGSFPPHVDFSVRTRFGFAAESVYIMKKFYGNVKIIQAIQREKKGTPAAFERALEMIL